MSYNSLVPIIRSIFIYFLWKLYIALCSAWMGFKSVLPSWLIALTAHGGFPYNAPCWKSSHAVMGSKKSASSSTVAGHVISFEPMHTASDLQNQLVKNILISGGNSCMYSHLHGSLQYQSQQCIFWMGNPSKLYSIHLHCSSPQMGNLMTPGLTHQFFQGSQISSPFWVWLRKTKWQTFVHFLGKCCRRSPHRCFCKSAKAHSTCDSCQRSSSDGWNGIMLHPMKEFMCVLP